MAEKKKAKPAKKTAGKKTQKKKSAAKKATKTVKAATDNKNLSEELQALDRKGLAARARQIKMELLAIRFNPQAPSLKDYRIKKRELATVLARLSS
jgi:hypothetical protein